jgi:hypothetical protein
VYEIHLNEGSDKSSLSREENESLLVAHKETFNFASTV